MDRQGNASRQRSAANNVYSDLVPEYRSGNLIVLANENAFLTSVTYLIVHPGLRTAAVIDPGSDGLPTVLAGLRRFEAHLDLILLTHEHFDHLASVEALREHGSCRVAASADCSRRMQDPKSNLSYFQGIAPYSPRAADLTSDEPHWRVPWQPGEVTVLASPGHTDGSVCFAIDGILFAGDTLIKGLPTVLNLPGGNRDKLAQSLAAIFSDFPPNTRVFPGHGSTFRLGESNPSVHQGSGRRPSL